MIPNKMLSNVITIRKRKAAKEHICNLCKDPILIEEVYIHAQCLKMGQGIVVVKGCEKHHVEDVIVVIKKSFPEYMRGQLRVYKKYKENQNEC